MPFDPILMTCAFAVGAAVGGLYFGGLWLTVRRLATARQPKKLLVISYGLRLSLLLAAFYPLARHGLTAVAAAMAGLLLSRHLWLASKGRNRSTPREA
ncbi:ATP synthase subunit I [Trichloromonas acetexigens]|nr:ATP synthase subunit I [Desulfuromonas acetexigens]